VSSWPIGCVMLTDLHGLGEPLSAQAQHGRRYHRSAGWFLLWSSSCRPRSCRQ